MSAPQILFVIGAGASNEAGLPLGSDLKGTIARLLDIRFERGFDRKSGDERLIEAFSFHARENDGGRGNINPYLHEAWKVRDGMSLAPSIDNFLDVHNDNSLMSYCGKAAIVRAILAAESTSKLKIAEGTADRQIDFKGVANTWYTRLWQKLTENCTRQTLHDRLSQVAFVIFNYDRCIEHFLHCAARMYYQLSESEATAALSSLQIYHPYGRVGRLPWESGENPVGFGADVHPAVLNHLANQIKTFTEGTDPTESDISGIRSSVRDATRIVFLGFAYHHINLELLFPSDQEGHSGVGSDLFGTAKGLSTSDCRTIADELSKGLKTNLDRIHLEPARDCSGLFDEFGRSLSLKGSPSK